MWNQAEGVRTRLAAMAVLVKCRCLSDWLIELPQASGYPQIKCGLGNMAAVHPALLPQVAALMPVCLWHTSGDRKQNAKDSFMPCTPDTKLGSEQPLLPLISSWEEPHLRWQLGLLIARSLGQAVSE